MGCLTAHWLVGSCMLMYLLGRCGSVRQVRRLAGLLYSRPQLCGAKVHFTQEGQAVDSGGRAGSLISRATGRVYVLSPTCI